MSEFLVLVSHDLPISNNIYIEEELEKCFRIATIFSRLHLFAGTTMSLGLS